MDNKNGGQIVTPPSWNAWGQAAARNAQQQANSTQSSNSGNDPQQLSPAQRQKQTATELARKRVLEAYKSQPQNYRAPSESSPTPQANNADWRKYHSAWQDYYQKYYGEYYGKAAQAYIEREKTRLAQQAMANQQSQQQQAQAQDGTLKRQIMSTPPVEPTETEESTSVQQDFRERIRGIAEKRAKKNRNSKLYKVAPILVGLAIMLGGVLLQYNQVIAAHVIAYMSPGNGETTKIKAIDPTLTVATHDSPYLMIPKLNVEVPVVFGSANDVASMNIAMGNGVAHFSIPGASAKPGQIGNFVISGHSAGNVYQNTNYKFIFSGLPRLIDGDLIYMDYEGTRYAYRMIGHTIVDPSDVNSLVRIANEHEGKPIITLLTCYPLGTSRQRYVIYAEQISPSYDDAASAAPVIGEETTEIEMPKGDPSPLEQFWNWLTGSA